MVFGVLACQGVVVNQVLTPEKVPGFACSFAVAGFVANQWLTTKPGGGGGNRTHVRGTPVAGFSVCSRLVYLTAWSVSWQPSSRPARKISTSVFGRYGGPAHLTSSLSDRRAEPRERRGYLRSQSVVIIGSCSCLHPINERMTLDTLPTTGTVPRQNLDAPRFQAVRRHINTTRCFVP